MLANHVKQISTEVIGPVITANDIKNIRTVAADPNVFQLLAQVCLVIVLIFIFGISFSQFFFDSIGT